MDDLLDEGNVLVVDRRPLEPLLAVGAVRGELRGVVVDVVVELVGVVERLHDVGQCLGVVGREPPRTHGGHEQAVAGRPRALRRRPRLARRRGVVGTLVLKHKRLAARDAGWHRDVERAVRRVDVEYVALADAVGHGELGADSHHAVGGVAAELEEPPTSSERRRPSSRACVFTQRERSRCERGTVIATKDGSCMHACTACDEERAAGLPGLTVLSGRFVQLHACRHHPDSRRRRRNWLLSGPNTATAMAQNCRMLSRTNRARQHIQRLRLAFLLRASLRLPPNHQFRSPKAALPPTTTPPRSTPRAPRRRLRRAAL